MQEEKRLLKNTAVYTIGNFGAKIFSFLMIPIYSYFMKPDDYGMYDLIITTISLFLPIITGQLSDAVFRWLAGGDDFMTSNESIISTVMKIFLINLSICIVLFGMINLIYLKTQYFIYIILLAAVNALMPILQQIIRGIGRNILYAQMGVFHSLLITTITFFSLIIFGGQAEVLLIGQIISGVITILVIICKEPIIIKSLSHSIDLKLSKRMLEYSLPLIPNTISWWIMNSSDRYVISLNLGILANGIYSMSNKFPAIVQALLNIFFMAWQESALKDNASKNRKIFFNKVFEVYYVAMFGIIFILIPFTKVISMYLLGEEYRNIWIYTGWGYEAVLFSGICSYFGVSYTVTKRTRSALYTVSIAAIINLLLDIVLVKHIGIMAAPISTFIAYLLLSIIRLPEGRKHFEIELKLRKFMPLLLYSFFSIMIVNYVTSWKLWVWLFMNAGITLALNSKYLLSIYNMIIIKIKK